MDELDRYRQLPENPVRKNPFSEVLTYFIEDANLTEYARNFNVMKESYTSGQPHVAEGIAGIRDLLQKVIFEQIFFNLLTAAKLKYIFNGASNCLKRENVIGLASFSRSTLEHTATYASIITKLESAVDRLTGQNNLKTIEDTLKTLSKFYHISYYGSGDRNEKENHTPKPIHIHDAIKDLDGYFGKVDTSTDKDEANSIQHSFLFQEACTRDEAVERFGIPIDPFPKTHVVRADYDFLCDFVHPNYGSNFLVTSGTLAEGLIDTPNEYVRNLNILFVKKCLRYWMYYKQLRLLDANANLKLSSWLQRAEKKGAKASRIFSKKAPKYNGDGKSIKTAYSFPTARDKMEEFDMFGYLLNDLKASNYQQSIAEVGQNFIVDRIELDDGRVVFVKWKNHD
jgi:hypothetical protein